MISCAIGGSGTMCCRWFLVRVPEMVQMPLAASSSRRIPATSPSRQPLNTSSFSADANGWPTSSVASQNARISWSDSTRSRAGGGPGCHTPEHGLTVRRRCRSAQRKKMFSAACILRPRDSLTPLLRLPKPGMPSLRASSTIAWISWLSRDASGLSPQISASPPLITCGALAAGSASRDQRSPSIAASSRQRRGRVCHFVL
jgi:hypothetical protein